MNIKSTVCEISLSTLSLPPILVVFKCIHFRFPFLKYVDAIDSYSYWSNRENARFAPELFLK
jgi:hypothetical protein